MGARHRFIGRDGPARVPGRATRRDRRGDAARPHHQRQPARPDPPGDAFTGTTVTAVDAEPGQVSIYLDVRNRGILTERLDAVEIDYPGLTVRDARFIPQTLGAFEAGQVAIDATIDCDAQLPGGEPAWDATATQTQQPAMRLTTTRPWGTVSAPWGTVSDTLPGWDIGWAILNGASGVCDLS